MTHIMVHDIAYICPYSMLDLISERVMKMKLLRDKSHAGLGVESA